MSKTSVFFASLLSVLPFFSAAAGELRLPAAPASVEVPAASPADVDTVGLVLDYDEVYAALKFYSDIVFVSPQGSPQYLEAAAAGQYLRARLESLSRAIETATGQPFSGATRTRARVTFRVSSELNDVFGFHGGTAVRETRSVPIKDGYCKINYVKNNVPFLVQSDSFLKKGEVILTFDDGPGPLTEEVSAAMKEGSAPSVFFVLGSKMGAAGKARVAKAAADGHEIAVHGYWHATESGKPFTNMTTGQIVEQLGGVKSSIAAASGRKPVFFRPPYGIITPAALKALDAELNLVPVGWTIDTLDWSTKNPDELFEKTIALIKQRGKGIVLMHDIHDQSRLASKRLVTWLSDNGYTVVSPERLTNAYRGE